MLIDSHAHIHESTYPLPVDEVLSRAHENGVRYLISVGTSEKSSKEAVAFSENYKESYAAIGVHPHDTKDGYTEIAQLAGSSERIVAVGEVGLDYFYAHSPKDIQKKALEAQLAVAQKHNYPVICHVRDAFDDFWPIFDSFEGLRGVLHSYTDTKENLQKALDRGLFIGVNGISTFTKDEAQQEMFDAVPLDKMLLETDAPFLTPTPYRGRINEPAYVKNVAEFHAKRRNVSVQEIASRTTQNARTLFNIAV